MFDAPGSAGLGTSTRVRKSSSFLFPAEPVSTSRSMQGTRRPRAWHRACETLGIRKPHQRLLAECEGI